MSLIKVVDVSKEFKDKKVLHNISVEFENGKGYAIIGHNGCGKSVFLKIITGFSRPTSGEIYSEQKKIGTDIDFIQNAGISINAPEFLNNLTGLENLQLLANIRKLIERNDIMDTVHLLRMDEYINKKVKMYSLGMKQKLRLAQALMEHPDILILDEPMNALDKDSVVLVRDILYHHKQAGKMLIFTSHNREDVEELADIIYEINDGKLQQCVSQ